MAANVTKDMTEGSPVKLILGFFIPMLCGLLFQQLYNMADTIIVGKCLGVKALAAVGSTGSVNDYRFLPGGVQRFCHSGGPEIWEKEREGPQTVCGQQRVAGNPVFSGYDCDRVPVMPQYRGADADAGGYH